MTPQLLGYAITAIGILIVLLVFQAERLAGETHKAMMRRVRKPERE